MAFISDGLAKIRLGYSLSGRSFVGSSIIVSASLFSFMEQPPLSVSPSQFVKGYRKNLKNKESDS
jgi:hypothetical protein